MGRFFRRAGALLCTCVLAAALLAAGVRAEPYDIPLEKLNGWGVVNGYADGQLHPERMVTRAQFVAMINRAYGYDKVGEHPFKDVTPGAWYADDIAIAYNVGYFTGTTASTAAPNDFLTRQQAMTLLAKNMRLDTVPGEVTEFTDGNRFAPYSKGYVKAAVEKGLIAGYEDGTFRPEAYITRGAMAILLYRALGTLIQEPGTYELDQVAGNLTIATPDTTLRNTTVAGDLYVTGGLGLAGLTLENVRVLGNIVVAGTGEAEAGDDSVVLRNVSADKLQVDSITGQYLSLRAEGTTSIHDTSVRTSAFLQDRTPTGSGLLNVALEGASGDSFALTGNLETVVNRTPGSTVRMAAGTAQVLTMDEDGAGSSLAIDTNATVKQLNLDTATAVTGAGDIDTVNITTTGTTVAMLPDNIQIRPGITSNVARESMDASKGAEASEDPRLLAGYPRVDNVAPTNCRAIFSGNKAGTVYWAVSGIADGSINEEELISPSAYGSKALKSGSVRLTASNTEARASVTGLTAGGSYYLSAIMVDARGTRSAIKVESFSTPDGTVPNFASGYPSISANTYDSASTASDRFWSQVLVMTNKDCILYWALYNGSSAAPTAPDFRTQSLSGSLARGQKDMTRSIPSTIEITGLEERHTYDIYFWLTDADFAQSSGVRKLTFTTVDGTPPVFIIPMTVTSMRATSIQLTCTVNEPATVYWAAVRAGTPYPVPQRGYDTVTETYAQIEISTGIGAVRFGSSSARANTPVNITVSGLSAQTAYDIWYLARDTAGNYSRWPDGDLNNPNDPNNPKNECMITANTLDNIPPTATQEFTRQRENTENNPYADTSVRLVFNEGIQRYTTGQRFLDLYEQVASAQSASELYEARKALGEALSACIRLYERPSSGLPIQVPERSYNNERLNEPWVIDFRNARVFMEEANLVILLPTVVETPLTQGTSALKLASGTFYYFELEDIADVSSSRNRMQLTRLPRFRTVDSEVALTTLSLAVSSYPVGVSDIDMSFSATPISTAQADASLSWDMLIWSDISCQYEVYTRVRDADPTGEYHVDMEGLDGPATDANGWYRVQSRDGSGGIGRVAIPSTMRGQRIGQSLQFNLYGNGVGETPALRDLSDNLIYEYAIRFLEVNGDNDRTGWSQEVNFYISVVSGVSVNLYNLAANITEDRFAQDKREESVFEVGNPSDLGFRLTRRFLDTVAPSFSSGRPIFEPGDVSVEMRLQISRIGTVFYALAPADGTITTRDLDGIVVDWNRHDEIPSSGSDVRLDSSGNEIRDENGQSIPLAPFEVSVPPYLEIVNPEYDNPDIRTGSTNITSGSVSVTVAGLIPETDYFAYFVIRGTGQTYSRYVQLYRFTTTEVRRPVLTLDLANPVVNIGTNREASVDFMVVNYNSSALSNLLSRAFWNNDPCGNIPAPSSYRNYAGITNVLQAMSTNLASTDDNGQGSVFDKYATQTYKDQLAEYIRASAANTAGTIIGVGHGIEVNPGIRHRVDCSEYPMSERAQYAFLAVGRSPSGSGDAFRGIYPLTLVDNEAPVVTAVQSTLTMDKTTDAQGNTKTLDTCSGRVSLTFNEYLFHSDDSTAPPTLRQVDRGSILTSARQEGAYSNFISIGSLVQSESDATAVGLMLSDSQVGRQTLTIDFAFDHAQDGTFITFNADLCDQYSNVRSSPLTVSIEIQKVRTVEDWDPLTGEPIYTAVSTPVVHITPAWDGRQNATE